MVDDHLEVRKILRDVLELDKRIKVVGQARNGQEAISKTKKLEPNIVLMDFKMPKMNGLQAAHYLKKNHPAIKIVLLSLYNDEPLVSRAKEIGVSRYLTKDLDLEEIVQSIIDVWEGMEEY